VSNSALTRLVSRIQNLPSLPVVVHRLIEVCKDPNATMMMVEKVIAKDQSLTAKVLKLVNSAFFALSSRVSTIHHAAVILGMDALRNMALAVCTYDSLAGAHASPYFSRRAFWKHAAAVGILAKHLAVAAKYSKPDEAFVAGLLHDIGKVILDRYFDAEFGRALGLAHTKELPLAQCELEVLGFDHALAGAELARNWNFPPQLVAAIEHHHEPAAGDALGALVAVADVMAKAWKLGNSGDSILQTIGPVVWAQVPLDEDRLREIIEDSREEVDAVHALFYSDEDGPVHDTGILVLGDSLDVSTGTKRIAFVTSEAAPLQPLQIYLEQSSFDVALFRPDEPLPADEAEGLVIYMPDPQSAQRLRDELVAKYPALRSVPTVCAAGACHPGLVVKSLHSPVTART
jgi:putative nucleotidyltransferase with HDIG domain